jgi:diguanylate cyclase (GGDEF)-like protein
MALRPGSNRILIVEDSASTRMVARASIESLGLEVLEAPTGGAGLELFEREDIALVLLDVGLPDLDGFEVACRIRAHEKGADVPIIMLTGNDDIESIRRSFAVGATDFASKPVSWMVLGQRLLAVLESTRRQREILAQREELQETQRLASIGSWLYKVAGPRFELSASGREVFDLPAEGDIRDIAFARLPEADRRRFAAELDRCATTGEPLDLKHRYTDSSESVRVVHTHARRVEDPASGEIWIHGYSQDVSVREKAEERARYLAQHDHLTGLKNQDFFREYASIVFAQQKRDATPLAFLLVNIEKFSRLNELHGRDIGDAVLRATGERVIGAVRATDMVAAGTLLDATVARVGGDEFCVAISGMTTPEDLARIAMRIVDAVRKPILLGSESYTATSRVGIAISPEDGDDLGALLTNANAACRHTTGSGSKSYEFYRASMNASARRRLGLETDFRQALLRKAIEIHYQPLIDMEAGWVAGAEALARWDHEEYGWVPPTEFVQLAEDAGLTFEFGRATVEAAMMQIRAWRLAGHDPISISVNISPTLLLDARLPQLLQEEMDAYGVDSSLVEVEITESVLIRHEKDAAAALGKLKALGLSIALDDFGTGYSALTHLQQFPVDAIKIDRSFVEALSDDRGRAIVRGVISMAHAMDLRVVAEGVESLQQRAFLASEGCDVEQGFLFSKAVSAEEFEGRFLCAGSTAIPGDDSTSVLATAAPRSRDRRAR